MAKAIHIDAPGGAEQMHWREAQLPPVRAGEARVRHLAVGMNYIDVYHRTGLYPLPTPFTPGMEACGMIEEVGDGVTHVKPGDRVAYGGGPVGAYAEVRVMPASVLVKVPDAISNEQAASIMVQGATAEFLVRRTFKLQPGHTCLIHAVAGGVGLILSQWAKHLGAMVIGTTSTPEKAKLASTNGCDHPVLYTQEDVIKRVDELTDGQGVDVVYDSVGKDTFMASLECLKPLGMMLSYGQASGPIPPFDIGVLVQKGSLFLTRPSIMHYMLDDAAYRQGVAELFRLVEQGVLKVHIGQSYPLAEAAQAHRDLEARKTQGSTILTV